MKTAVARNKKLQTLFNNRKKAIEKLGHKKFWMNLLGKVFLYLLLLDITYVFIYPYLYLVVTSLKPLKDSLDYAVKWIPSYLEFKNYYVALDIMNYLSGLKNSLLISVTSILGHIIACSFIGYGFARRNFFGRDFLFTIVILSFVVPSQVIIVPLFLMYTNLFGWMDSVLPMIIPTLFGYGLRGGLIIFLFRQYYLSLPKELEESASIDGCGMLRTHFSIILPLSKSVILTTSVLSLVWHWNDYFEPQIYIIDVRKKMLTQLLPDLYDKLIVLRGGEGSDSLANQEDARNEVAALAKNLSFDAIVMAATFMTVVPVLIIYLFMQKQFVEGMEQAGIKS